MPTQRLTRVAAGATGSDTRAPRRSQDRSGETRAKLVECAITCMAELGYTAATTTVIAERAGVSRGALQYHFASREDLDVAVIDYVLVELNFRVDTDRLATQPLEARVDSLIDTYWRAFNAPLFRAALNIWLAVASSPTLAKRLRDHLSQRHHRLESSWQTLFQDTGRTPDELMTIRYFLMGAIRGFAIERFFRSETQGRRERALLRELTLQALKVGKLHVVSPSKP